MHGPRRRRATAAAAATVALMLGACSSEDVPIAEVDDAPTSEEGATGDTLAPPVGLPAFYGVPDPIPDQPAGTLVRSEEIDAADVGGTLHRVMYVSESLLGEPIVVTGAIAVPESPPPTGGYPVIAWAHGTDGIADECASSLAGPLSTPVLNRLLQEGYVVTTTDYEGLGTPGRHPYLVGDSEARSVIDSVRAAGQLEGLELADQYLVWGHSQGGHAAMFALDIADGWAPELDLVGVVAGAPPSQFDQIYAALQSGPFMHYLLMAAAGLNAAYGDDRAPLDELLTAEGQEALSIVDEACVSDIADATADLSASALFAANPSTVPAWAEILDENDPGQFTEASDAPLLIIHGGGDEQISAASSALMFDQICAIGQDETRWVYPGQSHVSVFGPSLEDMLTWIDHRFAGGSTPDPMGPTGQAGIQVQTCP